MTPGLYAIGVTANQPRQRLLDGQVFSPSSFSPNGAVLTYAQDMPQTGLDIWTFTLADGVRKPLIQTPFDEESAVFSPDGNWIAYVSTETGRQEVFVAHYPDLAGKVPVSVDGGAEPVWGRNGRELFFRQSDAMMVAPIERGASLTVGKPRLLFRGRYMSGIFGLPGYDISAASGS